MASVEIIKDSLKLIKLSDKEYFSSKYKEYVSNSRLGLLDPNNNGSMEKFLNGIENTYSASLELGNIIHCLTLQKNEYIISEILKPSGKLGVFAEEVFNFRRNGLKINNSIQEASIEADYYCNKLTPARIKHAISRSLNFYLGKLHEQSSEKDILYIQEGSISEKFPLCLSSIENNYKIQRLLNPEELFGKVEVFNEFAIFCNLEVTLDSGNTIIIPFKAKLDNFTIDHGENVITLNDLKTTGKPINYFMGNKVKFPENDDLVWIDGSFQKYKYYRQMAVYLWLLQAICINTFKVTGFNYKANMLVVETIPNYSSNVYHVHNGYINTGLEEFKKLILILADGIYKGVKL